MSKSLTLARPDRVEVVEGRQRKLGNWSFVDYTTNDGRLRRSVYHYSTLMGQFLRDGYSGRWLFVPFGVGLGSVSDQQGMNQISRGYTDLRFVRNGGWARWE